MTSAAGDESDEEPLTGDGVTPGIVRIGDTVRRPVRPFTATIQDYLTHLHRAGFTGAPVPLGTVEQGREVLSYVPGDVPRELLPAETAGDEVLVALAQLIRAARGLGRMDAASRRGLGRYPRLHVLSAWAGVPVLGHPFTRGERAPPVTGISSGPLRP